MNLSTDAGSNAVLQFLGGGANFVVEIAAAVGWVLLPAAALFLMVRKLWDRAALVSVAALGLAILTRIPVFGSVPVLTNGALEFVGVCAVLLLVFLAAIPSRARAWTVAGVAIGIAAFEVIRVLSGQQSAGATVGGALIGAAFAAALGAVFLLWKHTPPRRPLWDGLPVGDPATLHPAPLSVETRNTGRRGLLLLAVGTGLFAALVAGGLLVTGPLGAVAQFDTTVVEWLAAHRSDSLNILSTIAGSFGTTPGVIAVLLVSVPLVLALTKRWAPVLFLLTAVIGETTIYLLTGLIIGRARPAVDHLSEGLPPTSSFPSGHAAAAVVVYGGLALLIYSTGRPGLRWTGFILAVPIVLGVAVSRLYFGVHYPSDVLASLLYAPVWLAACWIYLVQRRKPRRRSALNTTARGEP